MNTEKDVLVGSTALETRSAEPQVADDEAEQVVIIRRAPSRWPLAIAAIVICGIFAATFLAWAIGTTVAAMPGKAVAAFFDGIEGVGGALTIDRKYVEQSVVTSALQQLEASPKLVVFTAALDTVVDKRLPKSYEKWGFELPMGTTAVTLHARDNRVQYYVPLSDVTARNISFDGRTLRMVIPDPIVDAGLVDIQSDPSKVEVFTTIGWGRLDSQSGEHLRREARRSLRDAVLREAGREIYLLEARKHAILLLHRVVGDPLHALDPELRLEIEFQKSDKLHGDVNA